jgi:uncharacterized protein YeaO (DUF488 family)
MSTVKTKRIYEQPAEDDGRRYLVDRLWPRGVSKEKAGLTAWLKDAAPSAELCKWYAHDPEKWAEFRQRYFAELEANAATVQFIRDEAAKGPVTLVYAARAGERSNAEALKEFLAMGST